MASTDSAPMLHNEAPAREAHPEGAPAMHTPGNLTSNPSSKGAISPSTSVVNPDSATPITREKPTLLNIPSEFRNKIYSYVYEIPEAKEKCQCAEMPTHIRDLRALLLLLRSLERRTRHIQSTTLHPSLDSILACRQLYFDFKEMHSNTCQNYWPKTCMKIDVPDGSSISKAIYDIRRTSKAGLRYVEVFDIACEALSLKLEFMHGIWHTDIVSNDAKPINKTFHPRFHLAQEMHSRACAALENLKNAKDFGDPSQGQGLTADCITGILAMMEKPT